MPSLTFPPKIRLLKKHQFDRVFQTGQRLVGRHFVFIFSPSDHDYARLGIVISKAKCRRAVGRNRIKRRAREHFRQLQHQLPGVDLIVLLKSPIENSRDPAITKCLEKQFARLVARCNGSASN